MHVVTAPLNIYAANLQPLGASLKPIDFEKTERFGINSLTDFTWKDLLDLDACTECGRCTAVCPAHKVGKELSPRDIILSLRDRMLIGFFVFVLIRVTSWISLYLCKSDPLNHTD